MSDDRTDIVERWWRTAIADVSADTIRVRGYAIEDLLGRVSLGEMILLAIRGELPTCSEARLLEAAMLGAVVHGPHAPSIAIARMAITCGMGMNHAIAQGASALGDTHGGAVEQAMELLEQLAALPDDVGAIAAGLERWIDRRGPFVPGFGHRLHREADPRTRRLLALAEHAREEEVISGRYVALLRLLEAALARRKGKAIPMNLDAAAGAIFVELGLSPPVGRGLIVVARSIGVLAHAWEEIGQGGRLKGPVPRGTAFEYTGPAPRALPETMRPDGTD